MTITAKPKLTERNKYWIDVLVRVSHGEPVDVPGMGRSGIAEAINRARNLLAEQGRRIPDVWVSAAKTETGWRLSVRNWRLRQPTAEQRQAIEAFAMSGKAELFVGGLAVQDIESLVQEIAAATGVQLRAEYAVWHLPEGKTDRACWICKGGV